MNRSTPEPPAGADQAAIPFLIGLGRALHESGIPAHRLEAALARTAERLGIRAEFFSTPTSLFSSFGEPGRQHTSLSRVQPSELNLARLVALDGLVDGLTDGSLSVAAASERLTEIVAQPAAHGQAAVTVAFAVVAGTAGRILGGSWPDVALAAGMGLLTAGAAWAAARSATFGRLYDFLVALSVTVLCHAAAGWGFPVAPGPVVLAGLVILLPGLTLTLALNELATGHLVAGTARLTGALMAFLKIGLGVGLGLRLAGFLVPAIGPGPAAAPAAWTVWPALLLTPVGLTVLFGARWRDLPCITAGSMVAFWGARIGVDLLGQGLGAVAGALTAGLAGNVFARTRRLPAVVVLVPSLILLVPGTIGYRSFNLLLANDVVSGVETAFSVLLVGVSLVAGLLLANVLLPPRREL